MESIIHEGQQVDTRKEGKHVANQQVLELYCIKDLRLQRFLPPYFAFSRDDALRIMSEQVNFKMSTICSYPEDYELYFLGTFTDFTGEIDTSNPVFVINCKDLKTEKSLQYDDLLKEVKAVEAKIDASYIRNLKTFDEFIAKCEEKFKSVLDKFEESDSARESIITKLFH